MTDQKINMTDECLCQKCGFYTNGDVGIKSCPVIKMSTITEDGGECPACGAWIESQAEKEECDREWERIQSMSDEEIHDELVEAGIDVDKSPETTKIVVSLCVEKNKLMRNLGEKEESLNFLKKEVKRLENENLQLKRRVRSEFLRDVGALD